MMHNNDVFVKLNYKTIGEFKSLIIDKESSVKDRNKYLMCAGKYNKDGWTFVFKANSMKEAEEFINNNSIQNNKKTKTDVIKESALHLIDTDRVYIPTWV